MKIVDLVYQGLHLHPSPEVIVLCPIDFYRLLSDQSAFHLILPPHAKGQDWTFEGVPIQIDKTRAAGAISIQGRDHEDLSTLDGAWAVPLCHQVRGALVRRHAGVVPVGA